MPDRLKANVLEIQEAKAEAETLADDYCKAAIFWWEQWRAISEPPLPPAVCDRLAQYEALLGDLQTLLTTYNDLLSDSSESTSTSRHAQQNSSDDPTPPTPEALSPLECIETDAIQFGIILQATTVASPDITSSNLCGYWQFQTTQYQSPKLSSRLKFRRQPSEKF